MRLALKIFLFFSLYAFVFFPLFFDLEKEMGDMYVRICACLCVRASTRRNKKKLKTITVKEMVTTY